MPTTFFLLPIDLQSGAPPEYIGSDLARCCVVLADTFSMESLLKLY